MRKVTLVLSSVLGLCVLAQTAAAQTKQWEFGPQVSFATNSYGPAIGARAVFSGLGSAVKVPGLAAYGSFDYFFPSSSFGVSPTLWEINVNGTWDIPNMTGGFKPYVGAGLNYAHISVTVGGFSGSSSSTGLNILGGTHFNPTPKLNMFGEVRVELRSGSAIAFTVGLLF
jgi:Outer membrane protein beta-barrel domain